MSAQRALRPLPSMPEPPHSGLNRDLPRPKLAAIRRKVEAASVRPSPGSSDLLADDLWREEVRFGPRIIKVHDCTGMPSLALKRIRS